MPLLSGSAGAGMGVGSGIGERPSAVGDSTEGGLEDSDGVGVGVGDGT
jgi:hypothetical protein